MLEISNIDVCYGDLQALWQVSLKVNDGEIVTLVGSNGAGKSTILKTITGLLKPKAGSITYGNLSLNKLSVHRIVVSAASMMLATMSVPRVIGRALKMSSLGS